MLNLCFCSAGVGRLLLFDCATVQQAHLNRLFYLPQHVGIDKAEAAAARLREACPHMSIEPHTVNVATSTGAKRLRAALQQPDGPSTPELVLVCVDRDDARLQVNRLCLELGQAWMSCSSADDAMSGVHLRCTWLLNMTHTNSLMLRSCYSVCSSAHQDL